MLLYSSENDIMMMLLRVLNIYHRNTISTNRPDRIAQLVERWVSIPKVTGSSPAVARHIFQPAQCG